MKTIFAFAVASLLVAATARTAWCDSADAKIAPPGTRALADATRLVRDVYKDDIAKAKKPDEKAALGKKLLQVGLAEQRDMAGRYALFMIAKDIAEDAGDLQNACDVLDHAGRFYEIDELKMKSDAAMSVARSVRSTEERKALVTQVLLLVDQAVIADRYDLAGPLSDLAMASARSAGDVDLLKQALAHVDWVREADMGYAEVRKAKALLDQKPTDPDANLKVGKFLCFVKGDWQTGVPMLALGSDAVLKGLAVKELAGAAPVGVQVALGDGWWTLAGKESGIVRDHLRDHAARWYSDALPNLTGLDRAKAEARLKGPVVRPVIGTVAELRERLAGTRWDWPDRKLKRPWFKLNADGTVTAGWHNRTGMWAVTSPSTIVAVIMDKTRTPERYDVNLGPQATMTSEHGRVCKRLQ